MKIFRRVGSFFGLQANDEKNEIRLLSVGSFLFLGPLHFGLKVSQCKLSDFISFSLCLQTDCLFAARGKGVP